MRRFEDVDFEKNMIFSKQVKMGLFNFRLAYNVQLNKNVIVIGLPGDGKTFTFVLPNLMQMNSNFVVTDPKGNLVHEVGKMLEKTGYAVKIFDLIRLKNSDRFNPFHYMKSELDIDRISEAITEGTKKSEHTGEDFWVQAELMLQRALIGYLYFDSKDPETGVQLYMPNLGHVADLLRNMYREDPDVPSPVEQMFEELNEHQPNNYAYKQWKLFQNFRGETRNSVVAILSSRYSIFDHEDVRNLISEDTMEMDTWNTKKTAVFIAIPETNNALIFFPQSCLRLVLRFLHIRLMISCKGKYLATVEKNSSPHSILSSMSLHKLAVFQTSPRSSLLFVVVRCLLRLSSKLSIS